VIPLVLLGMMSTGYAGKTFMVYYNDNIINDNSEINVKVKAIVVKQLEKINDVDTLPISSTKSYGIPYHMYSYYLHFSGIITSNNNKTVSMVISCGQELPRWRRCDPCDWEPNKCIKGGFPRSIYCFSNNYIKTGVNSKKVIETLITVFDKNYLEKERQKIKKNKEDWDKLDEKTKKRIREEAEKRSVR